MAIATETITFPFPDQVLKLLPTADPQAITAFGDQVLETIQQTQDAVVKAVRTWAEASQSVMPELPSMPFGDQIPDPVALIENTFAFLDRLLATQKDFATAVLDAAKPVLGGAGQAGTTTTKATTRPSAKTTA